MTSPRPLESGMYQSCPCMFCDQYGEKARANICTLCWRKTKDVVAQYPDELILAEISSTSVLAAALEMDWQQVVINGGPPCFHLCEDGRFCGRARAWDGHDDMHRFVSLAELLHQIRVLPPHVQRVIDTARELMKAYGVFIRYETASHLERRYHEEIQKLASALAAYNAQHKDKS